MVVVLPAPLGPKRPTTSPARTANEMASTARTVPYSLVRFVIFNTFPSFMVPVFRYCARTAAQEDITDFRRTSSILKKSAPDLPSDNLR